MSTRMNAAWAAVIAALFGMLGAWGQAYLSRPHSNLLPPENPQVREAPVSPSVGRGFGGWVEDGLSVNVAYEAREDGFVAAYTGGNSPASGANLLSGQSAEALKTRTRVGGSYAGALLPVAKGHYWLVQPQSRGAVFVQWLPANPNP